MPPLPLTDDPAIEAFERGLGMWQAIDPFGNLMTLWGLCIKANHRLG